MRAYEGHVSECLELRLDRLAHTTRDRAITNALRYQRSIKVFSGLRLCEISLHVEAQQSCRLALSSYLLG